MTHPDNLARESTPLQAMDFAQLVDAIFSLYRNNFRLFVKISSVYFVYSLVLTVATLSVLGFTTDTTDASLRSGIIVTIVAAPFSAVVMTFVMGALAFATARIFVNEPISVGGAFKQVKRRFWTYIWGNILYLLVVVLLTITIIGIPFAVFFFIRWIFYNATNLFEENRSVAALKRSSELVKGGWWRVFGILLAIVLLILAVEVALKFGFNAVMALWENTPDEENWLATLSRIMTPQADSWDSLPWYIPRIIFNVAVTCLIFPLGVIGNTLLYFDRRIRKEGFDIEMRFAEARGD